MSIAPQSDDTDLREQIRQEYAREDPDVPDEEPGAYPKTMSYYFWMCSC